MEMMFLGQENALNWRDGEDIKNKYKQPLVLT